MGELLLALVLAPINASVPGLLVEMFPTPVRATGVALGYNIGQAIFGGTMPLVAFTLVEYTGKLVSPAWYVFSMALLVLTIGRAKGPTHG